MAQLVHLWMVQMVTIFQACSNKFLLMIIRIREIFIHHPQFLAWTDTPSLVPQDHVTSQMIHWAHQVNISIILVFAINKNLGFSKGAPPSMPLMPRYPETNGFPRASQPSNGLYNGQSGSPALGAQSGPRAGYSRQYSEPISSNNNFEFSSGFDMPKSSARPIPQKLRNE